jgi:hypothetical protein
VIPIDIRKVPSYRITQRFQRFKPRRVAVDEKTALDYHRRNKTGRDYMAEHVLHKKEGKKAPQKTLKEKREEKKNKKKTQGQAST